MDGAFPFARVARTATQRTLLAALIGLACGQTHAQFVSDFESPMYSASAAGTSLVGQNEFYVPTDGGVAGLCYTYSANALGVSQNPAGGDQFVACTRVADDFSRIQRNVSVPAGCAAIEMDVNLSFVGATPATNYAGSISLQPYPGDGSIILLLNWDDLDTAGSWSLCVLGFAADGGTPFPAGLVVPHVEFRNLPPNSWFEIGAEFDIVGNHLVSVSIRPAGSTGAAAVFRPANLNGFYLGGGAVIGRPAGAVRFFGGGGFSHDVGGGNTLAIDNLYVGPPIRECTGDVDLDGDCELSDLATLLAHFGAFGTVHYADGDLNCDARVDLTDLSTLLTNFGAVCE